MSLIVYLYSITLLIAAGLIGLSLSKRLNFPHTIAIIIIGFLFGRYFLGTPAFDIPPSFFILIITISAIMIVFDIFSRIELRDKTTLHTRARSFKILLFILAVPLLTLLGQYLFSFGNILYSSILAVLALSTSRTTINSIGQKKDRIIQFIGIESIKVGGFVILISAIITQILISESASFLDSIMPIILGAGTGIFTGIIMLRLLSKKISPQASHLYLLATVIITYSLAHAMGGNPLFSIIALGFFYGSSTIKKNQFLCEFSTPIARASEIMILLSIGIYFRGTSAELIIASAIFFAATLAIRYLALSITTKAKPAEKIFLTAYAPKDIVTGALILYLIIRHPGGETAFQALTMIILYSVMASYIFAKIEPAFLKKHLNKKESEF